MNMVRFRVVVTAMIPLCLPTDWTASADEPAKPDYAFVEAASFKGKSVAYKTTPGGKLSFKPMGRLGQVIDAKSGKPVGPPLDAGVMWTEHHPRSFSCWTFSPDGRHLVTGSTFFEQSGSVGGDRTVVGRIQIWAVATGKEVATFGARIGSVQSLAFSEDGKQIVFSAARFEIDGP